MRVSWISCSCSLGVGWGLLADGFVSYFRGGGDDWVEFGE